MEPFNIKVGFGEKEVTLTILPTKEGYYKVIYFGGIVGAVRPEADGEGWEQVDEDEITAGDLPPYEPNLNADRLNFVMSEYIISNIGEEISAILKE
ncbi:hypothetical protein ABIE26_000999 [Pedobacter africanus]|uniref:Uncharacterized protein n=1 Tax=Pedobacter africanus TaxID=151894 RepID=A0ACC6KTQ3_9SPHI|nr:hypothetical protein [Pedobacter africanus]MDR6782513.1 hypothetical protein [Pedobacter africanus]